MFVIYSAILIYRPFENLISNQMGIIQSPFFDPQHSRNLAFQLLISIRDMLYIALRKPFPPSYEQSFNLLKHISPQLYAEARYFIKSRNESDIIGYFREEANLQSAVRKKVVTAEDLIKKEIKRLQRLRHKSNIPDDEIKHILQRVAWLNSGLENLESVGNIPRDVTLPLLLEQYKNSFLFESCFDENFRDFLIANKRVIRVRLLTPELNLINKGVELVYEKYDEARNRSKLFVFSYISWSGGSFSDEDHNDMYKRLTLTKELICNRNICRAENRGYRFPCCSSFLRITDQLPNKDSKLVSSSLLIPNCGIMEMFGQNNNINRKRIKITSIKLKMFSEMYYLGLIGSEYIEENLVERFYRSFFGVRKPQSIILFVREKKIISNS